MAKEQGIPKIWENINNIKSDKLGKTEKASDSELLDGHDSSYFARQSDMDNKYAKSGGEITGNILIRPEKSIRILKSGYEDLDGEYVMGYVTNTNRFHIGMLSAEYAIFANSNPKVRIGETYYNLYHVGNKPSPSDIGALNKTGDSMTGTLYMESLNEQFRGVRRTPQNDLNTRLSSTEMSWSYTGVPTYGEITNGFHMRHNGNGVLTFNTHEGEYGHQIGLSSDKLLYHRIAESGGWSSWSTIFEQENCPISQSQNGWVKFANGLIIQWGKFTIGGDDTSMTTRDGISNLPLSFSNDTYCIIGAGSITGNNAESNLLVRPYNSNSFRWFLSKSINTSVFYIIAIGY